ncbi:MAG: hypothetical protein N2Z72_06395 [Bacteroidales bacterium]|nr:hypothetical protein [Bacteroidales bacterium]
MKVIFTVFFKIVFLALVFADDPPASKFEIKGYVQVQYQKFFVPDTIGGVTPYFAHFAGGPFVGFSTSDRFQIRRGRLKAVHHSSFSEAVLSLDLTERNVRLRDVYVGVSEKKWQIFGIVAGIFPKPFGKEVPMSSSQRPFPERARIIQTLFPDERDLGFMLNAEKKWKEKLPTLNFKTALVNGNGATLETDKWKDWIASLHVDQKDVGGFFSFSVGFSLYRGGMNHIFEPVDTVASNTNTKFYVYRFNNHINDSTGRTTKGFVVDTAFTRSCGRTGGKVNKIYNSVDLNIEFKSVLGKTWIYGEYIWGVQPTPVYYKDVEQAYIVYNGMNSFSYTGPMIGVSWPMYDQPQPYNPSSVGPRIKHYHTFIRKMNGGYIGLSQSVFQTPFNILFRFDWYDPNLYVKGKEITYNEDLYFNDPTYIKPYLSPADIAFHTFGWGFSWAIRENVTFTVFYDHVKNEKVEIGPYPGDLRLGRIPSPGYTRDLDDDVLTVRLQYQF